MSAPAESISLPNASDSTLRGDGQPCALPALAEGASHAELRCITPTTLIDLMDGNCGEKLQNYVVVDCRYPFEFEGGHIDGALNLWTQPLLEAYLLERQESTRDGQRTALIFHCEFSSHRGPNALRFIRNVDRGIHLSTYPALFFPEMYILDGGYKRFFHECPERCTPRVYIEMLDTAFEREHTEAQRTVKRTRDHSRQIKNPVIAKLRMAVEHAATAATGGDHAMLEDLPSRQ
jgi:rhodanese-related sulfurtransferase